MLALIWSELREFAHDVAGPESAARFGEEGPGVLAERLNRLADLAGEKPPELLRAFGRRLFERFVRLYPDFVPADLEALDYLEHIERHVHQELRALYPSAKPPQLCCVRVAPDRLLIRYGSDQPVAEMCEGMIEAALSHFEARAEIRRRAARGGGAVFEVSLVEAA